MRIGEVLDKRRQSWSDLDKMCDQFQQARFPFRHRGDKLLEFSALYRSACSDLAMADAYQLPPTTIEYLHRLVGRAHNQLYRSRRFQVNHWFHVFSTVAPQQIFSDGCVQVCSFVFFGLFIVSAIIAQSETDTRFPGFAKMVIGQEMMDAMEEMYAEPLEGHFAQYAVGAAGYIQHNTSIGLKCFALGPLILPTLWELAYNAVILGSVFGYMARPDMESGEQFFQFVTAHGPFELNAIVLSAAAGLRLGIGLVMTVGLRRVDSMRLQALRALPVIMASVVLFILAAFTEGFLSPSPVPYLFKAIWAILSSGALMFYFVVLGFPRGGSGAT